MSKIIISLKNLHNAAARAIIEKIDDGEHTAKELVAALEDGEVLAANGFTDEDIPAIDAACEYLESLHTYEVDGGVLNSVAGNLSEEAIRHCYQDYFTIGSFSSDEEAIDAANDRNCEDDAKAMEFMGIDELTEGPAYAANLYRINFHQGETS